MRIASTAPQAGHGGSVVVVVIGGLGSFWGTFLGALIYGQVLSFGILFFPRFSIFAVFALMAAVLIVRPWGLLGRPLK